MTPIPQGRKNEPAKDAKTLNIRVVNNLEELEHLRPDWEELLSQYPQSSIFSTWEWLAPWWRAYGVDQQLCVLAFYDDSHRLVGLAPLSISVLMSWGKHWKVLRLMGDGSGDSDNLDLPVVPDYEDAVLRLMLNFLDTHSALWDFCELNTLPSNSSVVKPLVPLLKDYGYFCVDVQMPCSCVCLSNSWEDYLRQLPSRVRTQYRSLRRRFEARPETRVYRCSQQADLAPSLEALFNLHQKHWVSKGQTGSFAIEARRKFYLDLSEGLLRRNWLEFWFLETNGNVIAADYGFRYGDTDYSLQAGFDPANAAERPGFWLKCCMLKALIESGVHRYDFLGGYSKGKARWNAQLSNYVGIHFARSWSAGAAYLRLRDDSKHSKEWLRTHLPPPAWRVLHGFNTAIHGN